MTKRATLRAIGACIDDMESDKPSAALYRQLQDAQRRWRNSRGRKRDAVMKEMLRISKALDNT
jgi:hypothetical protein